MVAHVAHFWRKLPHEIWSLPFTYYVTVRDDFLDIVNPKGEDGEDLGELSLQRLDELAEKGITDIDFDAVLRQQRKVVRHGR